MAKISKVTPKVKERFGADKMSQAVDSLAEKILSSVDFEKDDAAFIGIQTRGATLAERLAGILEKKRGKPAPFGVIDITLYRDDFSTKAISPVIGETHLDYSVDDKTIILVDDVLYTGRTIRAALDEIMDFGRPKKILLAVLVDRGHRELPIQADLTGIQINTKLDESVIVKFKENDGEDDLIICEPVTG